MSNGGQRSATGRLQYLVRLREAAFAPSRQKPRQAQPMCAVLVDAIARYSNNRGGSLSLEELERIRDLSTASVPEHPIPATAPRSNSRHLDAETLAAMVEEYNAGATTAELRLKYSLAQGSLLKLLRANGAVNRRQGLTAAQEKAAVGLYEYGPSIGSIAGRSGAVCYERTSRCVVFTTGTTLPQRQEVGQRDRSDQPQLGSEI